MHLCDIRVEQLLLHNMMRCLPLESTGSSLPCRISANMTKDVKYQQLLLIAANSSKTTRSNMQKKVLILPQRGDDKIRKTYLVKYFHLHLQLLCFWRKLRLTAGKHFTVLASSTFGSLSGVEKFSRCLFLFSSEREFIDFSASGPKCRAIRVGSQVYTVVIWHQRVLALFSNTIPVCTYGK